MQRWNCLRKLAFTEEFGVDRSNFSLQLINWAWVVLVRAYTCDLSYPCRKKYTCIRRPSEPWEWRTVFDASMVCTVALSCRATKFSINSSSSQVEKLKSTFQNILTDYLSRILHLIHRRERLIRTNNARFSNWLLRSRTLEGHAEVTYSGFPDPTTDTSVY